MGRVGRVVRRGDEVTVEEAMSLHLGTAFVRAAAELLRAGFPIEAVASGLGNALVEVLAIDSNFDAKEVQEQLDSLADASPEIVADIKKADDDMRAAMTPEQRELLEKELASILGKAIPAPSTDKESN